MTLTTSSRLAWPAVLLVIVLAVAACGGEDEPAAVEATTPATDEPIDEETPEPVDDIEATEPAEEPADDEPASVEVALTSLPALDDDGRYGLWADTGDGPERIGSIAGAEAGGDVTVTVDADEAGLALDDVRTLLVAVEAVDTTGGAAFLLAGEVDDGQAALTIDHPDALGATVAAASGSFILGTPTDPPAPETAGLWFVQLSPTRAALQLATLPEGWTYEGWATVGDTTLSAGRFSAADIPAVGARHNGPESGPDLPGGDFVANPPDGVDFPWELHGARVQVALAPAAFDLAVPLVAVLVGETPDPADDHVSYPLTAPERLPEGSVSLNR